MGRKKGKRQSDPSRDEAESTDSEKEETDEVSHTACPHVGKAVQLTNIKKNLKIAWVRVGQCSTCLKENKSTTPVKKVRNEVLRRELGGKLTIQEIKKEQLERAKAEQRAAAEKLKIEREAKAEVAVIVSVTDGKAEESSKEVSNVERDVDKLEVIEVKPVETPSIWLCMRCGSQGCGNNSKKHSFTHYKVPRSDLHCLVVNTDTWVIWCYDCQTEIYVDSHKKLYEAVEYVKKVKIQPGKVLAQIKTPSAGLGSGVGVKVINKDIAVSATSQSKVVSSSNKSLPKVKGLNNLGNTCFFNSVMQCLSQTHILTQFIDMQASQGVNFKVSGSSPGTVDESDSDSSLMKSIDIFSDLSMKLAEGGPMITSLAAFFKDMHSGGKSMVISPGHLFGQVVKQSPKFRGMQQQDSHELLRYLMDGLRNEESKRQKSAILKYFGLTEKSDPKKVPNSLRKKLQAYGRESNQTFFDKIFSGQMVSTIVCEECHHSSQNYEQFLDLSLPVVEDKPSKPQKSPKRVSGFVLPDDEGQEVSCCGAQEERKRSKNQIKKEKERRRRENRSKKIARQISKAESVEEKQDGEKKIREELQGNEKFEKVELKIEDSVAKKEAPKVERKDSVTWKDGNNDEEEGYEEGEEDAVGEEGDWEWDYGEPWEEKQKLIFKPKCKETNDDTSDYLDVSTVEESREVASADQCVSVAKVFEHENSSERTGVNTDDDVNETGASSNGDVEDNTCDEDRRKMVLSKNLLNNLQNLDNLMTPIDNLAPHMQELCKGISDLRMDNGNIIDKEKHKRQRVNAEWTARTLTSLAPRYQTSPGECSIYSCLNNFTQSELLTGQNKWACDSCTEIKRRNSAENSDCSTSSKKFTVYSAASKQLLLFCPPAVLTLHLKRFQQTLSGCKKLNKHVSFPLDLDLAAFCSSTSIAMPNVSVGQEKILYSLYGVVEHSGRLQGGHYTAYVKVRAANSIVVDPTKFFSPALSKASDVSKFLDEIESKFKTNRQFVSTPIIEDESNNNLTQTRKWYHVSDSSVADVSEEKVLKAQAYLLFYERIL